MTTSNANPNPTGFVTKRGGYIAFAHVVLVRRHIATERTIVSLPTRDVELSMPQVEHEAFVAALAFWASGA